MIITDMQSECSHILVTLMGSKNKQISRFLSSVEEFEPVRKVGIGKSECFIGGKTKIIDYNNKVWEVEPMLRIDVAEDKTKMYFCFKDKGAKIVVRQSLEVKNENGCSVATLYERDATGGHSYNFEIKNNKVKNFRAAPKTASKPDGMDRK